MKTPLLRRRGFWITVGVVLGVALLAALAYGIVQERANSREEARLEDRATAVAEFGRAVEPILGTVGEPSPPAGWTSFTELETAIADLEADPEDVAPIAETAETVQGTAGTAWQAVENDVDVPAIVAPLDLDQGFVLYLTNSRERFVQSLRLYEEAAGLVLAATEADGPARAEILERASGVVEVAGAIFARGYSDYVEAQAAAGTFEPVAPGPAVPGLPGSTGPTG